MKKETIISVRVTPEIKTVIQAFAEEDDRTLAWMVRKLLLEAIEARSLSEKTSKHGKSLKE